MTFARFIELDVRAWVWLTLTRHNVRSSQSADEELSNRPEVNSLCESP